MTKKVEKPWRDMLQELHQGVYGIPDTEEHGLLGDVKELITVVLAQNTRIRKNEQTIFKLWGILIGIGAATGVCLGLGLRMLGVY